MTTELNAAQIQAFNIWFDVFAVRRGGGFAAFRACHLIGDLALTRGQLKAAKAAWNRRKEQRKAEARNGMWYTGHYA